MPTDDSPPEWCRATMRGRPDGPCCQIPYEHEGDHMAHVVDETGAEAVEYRLTWSGDGTPTDSPVDLRGRRQ